MPTNQTKPTLWLAAALFPLKVYTVAAGLALWVWHASKPRVPSDLAYVAGYAACAYYFVAGILILGGAVQWVVNTRKGALWTWGLGIAGVIIGLLLRPLTLEAGLERLATVMLNQCAQATPDSASGFNPAQRFGAP